MSRYLSQTGLVLCCAGLLLAGCSASSLLQDADNSEKEDAAKTMYPKPPFDEAETKRAMEKGTGSLRGVFWTGSDFDKEPLKNKEVTLMPATAHVEAWYKLRRDQEHEDGVKVFLDSRMAAYQRKTKTDAYGRFAFDGLKPGKYLLWTNVVLRRSYSTQEHVGTSYDAFGGANYYRSKQVNVANATDAMTFVTVVAGKETAVSLRGKDCNFAMGWKRGLCHLNRD